MALILLVGLACEPASTNKKTTSRVRAPRLEMNQTPQAEEADFGQDWDAVEGLLSSGSGTVPAEKKPLDSTNPGSRLAVPRYGICVATFSSDSHRAEGNEYIRRLGLLLPGIGEELSIYSEPDQSMVLYGDYDGWNDPKVRDATAKLRNVRIQGRKIFETPILTEVVPPRDPSTIDPIELLSLRLNYPEARTLYTVEIAVWGDFESGELPPDRRRKIAEDYARSLRSAGHKAWFHHDELKQMSTVTIGVFDHRAVDAASGIRSPAVERVVDTFPMRLVNGEPLMIPVIRGDPGSGSRPQKPMLVEVPRL
ncbi:MAG: hypothetical protein CMJ40_05635 [Phycisphaerae bacterium]|nr:hypothetical protein [Phycisphaerae bacterium]